MADRCVSLEQSDHIACITLNRPEKRNALNLEMRARLEDAFAAALRDDGVRAVVLTGTGPSFCAGADLGPSRELGIDELWTRLQQPLLSTIRDFPKPVVAAVQGLCRGLGVELALWCDIVIAAEGVTFAMPAIRHGSLVQSMIPWLTTPQQAKRVLLTGDAFSAQQALAMGLITQVVPPAELAVTAQKLARRMGKIPPFAMRYGKHAINAVYDAMGFRLAMEYVHKMSLLSQLRIPEARTIDGVLLEDLRRLGAKAYREARDAPFADDD